MDKLISWVKDNKVITIILIVVVYILFNLVNVFFGVNSLSIDSPRKAVQTYPSESLIGGAPNADLGASGVAMEDSAAPSVELEQRSNTSTVGRERLVIQNSTLSLVVDSVRSVGNEIIKFAEDRGGYMVTASYNQPEESAFATITVRVPTRDLGEALQHFRDQAIKVSSENLVGRDVTEQYVDIEERLLTLERTKTKFEAILEQATEIDDILRVQRELINLQNQIDSYRGRMEALEEEAELTKITVYLSTDELSLPYTPDDKFRPRVVFKLAVRSLLSTLTGLGELAIWVGVYSVIWGPILAVYLMYRRWKKNKEKQSGSKLQQQ